MTPTHRRPHGIVCGAVWCLTLNIPHRRPWLTTRPPVGFQKGFPNMTTSTMTTDPERVAIQLETITEDHHAPVDVTPRFSHQSGDLTGFTISTLLPDATITPGATPEATAAAVADQLDQWAGRFSAAAVAIRGRFAG